MAEVISLWSVWFQRREEETRVEGKMKLILSNPARFGLSPGQLNWFDPKPRPTNLFKSASASIFLMIFIMLMSGYHK